jgi:4-amino-4-deoxy-L-arabinose transferase-like glycosyltransferase
VLASTAQADRKLFPSPAGWALLLFLLALIPRLPGLRVFLTSDEPNSVYWASSQFVEGLLKGDLSLTYWHFYPGVTMSWVETLGLAVSWLLARLSGGTTETLAQFVRRPILDLILAVRLPHALLAAGGVAGLYLLARRLLGHRTALLGALFIALDPFYLAHSRVAHGDAPVTVFMGLSMLAFLVYLQGTSPDSTQKAFRAEEGRAAKGRSWLILSAVMGALAALTKAPGPFMVLFVVMVALGDWLLGSWHGHRPDRRLARRWLADLALWGGVAALLFVVLWPAMWINPVGTLLRMLDETFGKVEEGHLVFFMEQPTLNPGPWFYPYVISFRLTPITLIGAVLSAVFIALRSLALVRKIDEESEFPSRYIAAALLWFYVISLLLFGNLSPKKQDRYLLPLLPILDVLAAFSYVEIMGR